MKNKNRIRESKGSVLFDAIIILLVSLLTLVCFYPMYYVLMASFSNPVQLMNTRTPLV